MKHYKSFIEKMLIIALLFTLQTSSQKIRPIDDSLSKNEEKCYLDRDYERNFAKKYIQKKSEKCQYSSIYIESLQVRKLTKIIKKNI